MKRLVPKVLENTYHVYSYKVQLVYNYTTRFMLHVQRTTKKEQINLITI